MRSIPIAADKKIVSHLFTVLVPGSGESVHQAKVNGQYERAAGHGQGWTSKGKDDMTEHDQLQTEDEEHTNYGGTAGREEKFARGSAEAASNRSSQTGCECGCSPKPDHHRPDLVHHCG